MNSSPTQNQFLNPVHKTFTEFAHANCDTGQFYSYQQPPVHFQRKKACLQTATTDCYLVCAVSRFQLSACRPALHLSAAGELTQVLRETAPNIKAAAVLPRNDTTTRIARGIRIVKNEWKPPLYDHPRWWVQIHTVTHSTLFAIDYCLVNSFYLRHLVSVYICVLVQLT